MPWIGSMTSKSRRSGWPQWVATVIVGSDERFAETGAGLWLAMAG